MVKKLWDIIVKDNFRYFVDNVKSPLQAAIILYGMKFPEPVEDNVNKPESLLLIEYFDYIISNYSNPSKLPLFKAIKRIVIGVFESDDSYAPFIHLFLFFISRDVACRRWKLHLPNKYTVFWEHKEGDYAEN